MKTNSYFLLLLLVVCSCSDGKQKSLDEPELTIDEFRSYKIDMDMSQTRLVDLIDTIEVMRLEETAESLLAHVNSLQEFSDGYILHQKIGIVFFNERGDFMHSFNHKGSGPDQYADVYDFWIEGDTIAIFPKESQHIKRYDLDGNFLSSFRLPYYAHHVYPTENGFVYDLNYGFLEDSLKFRLIGLNSKHEFEKAFLPFDVLPKMHVFSQFPSIKPYGNGATYLGVMSDSLYLVNVNQVRPLVHFDFGEKWHWTEEAKMNPKMYMASKGEKVDNINAYIGEEYIWLSASYIMFNSQPFLINRPTGAVVSIDLRNQDDGRYTISPIKWEGNTLFGSIQSNDLSTLISELDQSRVRFRKGTTLEEIESSENPVLMWVKFKK
jgi:hypothetical protein